MDKLLVWLLFAVPEGVLMVLAGFGVLGVRPKLYQAVICGLLVGTVTVTSRAALGQGYHIPAILLAYVLITMIVLKVSFRTAAVACFLASILINVGQLVIGGIILHLTGTDFQRTIAEPRLNIVFGWIGNSLLLAATVIVSTNKIMIVPVPESERRPSLSKEE